MFRSFSLYVKMQLNANLTSCPMSLLAKHFDRDPVTNEVLWFPAAPVDIARPTKPKYSLTYLHFLATKRKRDVTGLDDDDSDRKRGRFDVPPTITESLASAWRDVNAGA